MLGREASGKGVSGLDLIALACTMRNCPDSPASKPGGMNLSQRGSESCSATAVSIRPVLAQNLRSSHTAVRMAFTVEPDRYRSWRIWVISKKCLKRARSESLIVCQSRPFESHQPRKAATRPAYTRTVFGESDAPLRQRRKSDASRCTTT